MTIFLNVTTFAGFFSSFPPLNRTESKPFH